MNGQKVEVKTPVGTLVATPTGGGDYPGIQVELKRDSAPCDLGLALVEYNKSQDVLRAHIWSDAMAEDPTIQATYDNVEQFFENDAPHESGSTEKAAYRFFPANASVDLGYLVEDWQQLVNAIASYDWNAVRVTADCIAELIQSSLHDNPNLKFQPSASSVVAQGVQTGILAKPDGTDFECAAGRPMHEVIISETPQCPDGCAEKHGCNPDYCRIKMACGHMYDGRSMSADELLKALGKTGM